MKIVGVIVVLWLVLGCLVGAGVVGGMFLAAYTSSGSELVAAPTLVPLSTLAPAARPTKAPVSIPTQATGGAKVFTVSETDLNQQMLQKMPQDGQISNPYIDLHPGNTANASATVNVNSSLTLQPNLLIRFTPANGRVTIDVVKVNVGGFGVPSSMIEPQINALKTDAENEMNRQLEAYQNSTGMKLIAVITTEDSLTVTFAP